MANELKIKNGLIVQGQIIATGITSSLNGSSSFANVANSINFVPTVAVSASWASQSLSSSYISATNVIGIVSNATSSSYAGTASILLGSVSNAIQATSASWASSSVSSSFSSIASSLIGLNFNNTGSIISALNTLSAIISVSTGSYIAAFFDYAAISASNVRAGTVFGSWVNGSITYTEVSNVDVGDTSPVTMSLGLNGASVQLSASVSTTPWTIKALGRYI